MYSEPYSTEPTRRAFLFTANKKGEGGREGGREEGRRMEKKFKEFPQN